MLLVVSLALAEPADMDCGLASLSATSPAPFAVDVPVDVIPAGLLDGGTCGGSVWTGTLLLGDSVIVTQTQSSEDGWLLELDPGAELEPDTEYLLRFEPTDGGGEVSEVGFTTGEGHAAGLVGAPSVDAAVAEWTAMDGVLLAGANTIAADSEDGETILALTVDGVDRNWRSASGDVAYLSSSFVSAQPSEVCVGARQRDVAGRWTDAEEACVTASILWNAPEDEGFGCGVHAITMPALGLLFLRKRR